MFLWRRPLEIELLIDFATKFWTFVFQAPNMRFNIGRFGDFQERIRGTGDIVQNPKDAARG